MLLNDDDVTTAVILWGAATVMHESTGRVLEPREKPRQDAALARVRAALGEAEFAALWQMSHALTGEQVVQFALGKVDLDSLRAVVS